MSLTVPSWRSAPRCLFYSRAALPIRTRDHQKRALSYTASKRADESPSDNPPQQPNPVLEEYKRNHPELPKTAAEQQQQQGRPRGGDISASSIFEDERRAQMQVMGRKREVEVEKEETAVVGGQTRNTRNMLRVLDPDPNARERWERKKVIQTIRRGGRLNKQLFIKRTERQHLVKSHNMKTSVKKLGKLTRQIAGKQIDDAITQMRFSKKKVATDVLKQLEFARDEAVVTRGMGLGQVQVRQDQDASTPDEASADVTSTTDSTYLTKKSRKGLNIQLKDGSRHIVSDKSRIYIDQAWVGRGPYGKLPDYRAKGRMNVMRTPFTSMSLLLKEEATRVREWEEREARRKRERTEKVWVPLPDRPVQVKSQWYSCEVWTSIDRLSIEADKAARVECFLKSLDFAEMSDRGARIKDSYSDTFAWIFEQDTSPVKTWLEPSSNGSFWICGKAGSGKSTLMKFVAEHPCTTQILQSWAGSSQLIVADFFFWNPGVALQKAIEGFWRTALFKVFHQCPSLIPAACPTRWNACKDLRTSLPRWTPTELDEAFKALIHNDALPVHFCFFIDGLDECEGEHDDLLLHLAQYTISTNAKFCVSKYGNRQSASFTLQDLTKSDMDKYIRGELESCERFVQLCQREPRAIELVQDIRERACGVFLWVYLEFGWSADKRRTTKESLGVLHMKR